MNSDDFVSREEYQEVLEDVAYLKRELFTLTEKLKSRKLGSVPVSFVTPLGQVDNDLSTDEALQRLVNAKIATEDPIFKKVEINGKSPKISAGLGR